MFSKTKISMLAIFAAMLGLALISCDRLPVDPEDNTIGEVAYFVTEIDAISEVEITDGTIEEPFEIMMMYGAEESDEPCKEEPFVKGRKFDRDKRHKGGRHLGGIFRELGLDDEQKEQLKTFFEENKECASQYFQALREASAEYRESANEQRDAVIEALKSGDITREEAHTELEAIRADIKEQMMADEDRQALIDAIKACRDALNDKIASILDDEQLALWEAWLAEMEARRNG